MGTFVVARRRQQADTFAVAHGEDAQLASGQPLLDDDSQSRLAEALLDKACVDGGLRRGDVIADGDPLAEGQPVRLDHTPTQRGGKGEQRRAVLDTTRPPRGGGDARSVHQPFGELLRRLDATRGRGRTEHRDRRDGARIGEPGGDRRVRPDDDEVDGALARDPEDGFDVVGPHRHVLGDHRRPPVAGRAEHLCGAVTQAPPCQRVLTGAGAGDEDPAHATAPSSRASRRSTATRQLAPSAG